MPTPDQWCEARRILRAPVGTGLTPSGRSPLASTRWTKGRAPEFGGICWRAPTGSNRTNVLSVGAVWAGVKPRGYRRSRSLWRRLWRNAAKRAHKGATLSPKWLPIGRIRACRTPGGRRTRPRRSGHRRTRMCRSRAGRNGLRVPRPPLNCGPQQWAVRETDQLARSGPVQVAGLPGRYSIPQAPILRDSYPVW